MKKLIILLLVMPYFLSGQIIFENTYSSHYPKRIHFPSYGEKYYFLNAINNNVEIYNSDHSLWKTINLVLPPNSQNIWLFSISEDKINNDNLLEISYRFSTPNSVSEAKIINESGTILASFLNTSQMYLSELDGLSNKIITYAPSGNESIVFSLPSFSIEHHYIQGNINRIDFDNAGEKYYLHNQTTNQVKVFNSDHSLWKTIDLPAPANMTHFSIRNISQTKINPDNLIDIIYAFKDQSGSYSEIRVINDTGQVMLAMPNTDNVILSELGNLDNKIIAWGSTNSNVYALPSMNLEITYTGIVQRIQLGISGEKYYRYMGNSVNFFNADHSSWKSFNLPPFPGGTSYITHLSQTLINPDSLIEVAYVGLQNVFGNLSYQGKIVTESGQILLNTTGSFSIVLSQLDTLENKIFINTASGETDVYGISIGTPIVHIPYQATTLSVAPNPANNSLMVDNSNGLIQQLHLFNVDGKLVKEIPTHQASFSIDVSDLPNGIYFIHGRDNKETIYTNKIIIRH